MTRPISLLCVLAIGACNAKLPPMNFGPRDVGVAFAQCREQARGSFFASFEAATADVERCMSRLGYAVRDGVATPPATQVETTTYVPGAAPPATSPARLVTRAPESVRTPLPDPHDDVTTPAVLLPPVVTPPSETSTTSEPSSETTTAEPLTRPPPPGSEVIILPGDWPEPD